MLDYLSAYHAIKHDERLYIALCRIIPKGELDA